MKVGLIALLAVVLLGGLLGTLIVQDPGYVLIAYGDKAWETSLWFALAMFILLYVLVRVLFFAASRVTGGFGGLAQWARERKARAARKKTAQGLLLWAEGDWRESSRLLADAAPAVEFPLVNYLHAARAADALGDEARRDEMLAAAEESTPGSRFAVGLTHAELLCGQGHYEQALARLLKLRGEASRHPLVLRLLTQCYEALGDWEALLELLPDVQVSSALDEQAFDRLLERAWTAHLAAAPAEEAWKNLPKHLKKRADVVAVYARALMQDDQGARAEVVLRQALKSDWSDALVVLYGEIDGGAPREQLAHAEQWLRKHPNDAALLLALGRLSMRCESWPKAREYFETSLRLRQSADVYGELGRLCIRMGDVERGGEYMLKARPDLPELPLPSTRGVVEDVAG